MIGYYELHVEILVTDFCRYPSLYYTAEGRKLTDRLWEETVDELQAAGAAGVLEGLK